MPMERTCIKSSWLQVLRDVGTYDQDLAVDLAKQQSDLASIKQNQKKTADRGPRTSSSAGESESRDELAQNLNRP
jgi:hypothetical protein